MDLYTIVLGKKGPELTSIRFDKVSPNCQHYHNPDRGGSDQTNFLLDPTTPPRSLWVR